MLLKSARSSKVGSLGTEQDVVVLTFEERSNRCCQDEMFDRALVKCIQQFLGALDCSLEEISVK